MLSGDIKALNQTMNCLTLAMFSSFDTAGGSPGSEPERFYHGFVLGLLVKLQGRYRVTSNRESGYGRYDVMLEPLETAEDPAVIMEFKSLDADEENDLTDTVSAALKQIEERRYDAALVAGGIPEERIRKYGFAFKGKQVLIDMA